MQRTFQMITKTIALASVAGGVPISHARNVGDPRASRRVLAVTTLGLFISGCGNAPPGLAETAYPSAIVGSWRGTVGDFKEVMTLQGDGTFTCQLAPAGFIATMIYPVPSGSVSGTWRITGKVVTLEVSSAHNERLQNGLASSTIVAFNGNRLVIRSHGNTATFERVDPG